MILCLSTVPISQQLAPNQNSTQRWRLRHTEASCSRAIHSYSWSCLEQQDRPAKLQRSLPTRQHSVQDLVRPLETESFTLSKCCACPTFFCFFCCYPSGNTNKSGLLFPSRLSAYSPICGRRCPSRCPCNTHRCCTCESKESSELGATGEGSRAATNQLDLLKSV